jgi:chromosome partitioning protein
MKVITLLAQKGGSGKSTAAINLAVAAEAGAGRSRRTAAIVDADPQASAAVWRFQRAAETPVVIAVGPGELGLKLEACRKAGAGFAFIDTAPHTERAAVEAARLADLLLIPCRPSLLDIKALAPTAAIAAATGRPVVILLNAAPAKAGAVIEAARLALSGYALPVAPISLGQRAAFQNSLVLGLGVVEHEPRGKAADEVMALWRWLHKRLGSER